jgi:hypothetical protein
LIQLIDGRLLTGSADLTKEVKGGCGADLMSDVLASIQPKPFFLQGFAIRRLFELQSWQMLRQLSL